MNTKLRTTVNAFALAIAGIFVTGAALAADCTLWADKPQYNGAISGEGSWANCPANAKVTVLLRRDHRWWFDSTLDSKSETGSSGRLSTSRACGTGFDPWKVYVETRYGSKKTQSPRAVLPCK
jgi:hypothetical protein